MTAKRMTPATPQGAGMNDYTFTSADVEAEVRRIAAENPEHVYQSPDGPHGAGRYVHDVEGGREAGCLIGRGFAALGVSMGDLAAGDDCDGLDAERMMEKLCGSQPLETRWISAVQRYQDRGFPWGKAVQWADEDSRRFAS